MDREEPNIPRWWRVRRPGTKQSPSSTCPVARQLCRGQREALLSVRGRGRGQQAGRRPARGREVDGLDVELDTGHTFRMTRFEPLGKCVHF